MLGIFIHVNADRRRGKSIPALYERTLRFSGKQGAGLLRFGFACFCLCDDQFATQETSEKRFLCVSIFNMAVSMLFRYCRPSIIGFHATCTIAAGCVILPPFIYRTPFLYFKSHSPLHSDLKPPSLGRPVCHQPGNTEQRYTTGKHTAVIHKNV